MSALFTRCHDTGRSGLCGNKDKTYNHKNFIYNSLYGLGAKPTITVDEQTQQTTVIQYYSYSQEPRLEQTAKDND